MQWREGAELLDNLALSVEQTAMAPNQAMHQSAVPDELSTLSSVPALEGAMESVSFSCFHSTKIIFLASASCNAPINMVHLIKSFALVPFNGNSTRGFCKSHYS
jgi:hypothetical protein